jgi:hypothetical protein
MEDTGSWMQGLVTREHISASRLAYYGKPGTRAPASCPRGHVLEKQSITIRRKILENF